MQVYLVYILQCHELMHIVNAAAEVTWDDSCES